MSIWRSANAGTIADCKTAGATKAELSKAVFEKKWRPIHKDLKDLLGIRAVIAHQPVLRVGTGKGNSPFFLFSIRVEEAELEVKSFEKLKGKTSLSMKDLRGHTRQAERLVERLGDFVGVLTKRKAKRST